MVGDSECRHLCYETDTERMDAHVGDSRPGKEGVLEGIRNIRTDLSRDWEETVD